MLVPVLVGDGDDSISDGVGESGSRVGEDNGIGDGDGSDIGDGGGVVSGGDGVGNTGDIVGRVMVVAAVWVALRTY